MEARPPPISTSPSSSPFQKTANSADENKTKEREISLLFGGESPRQPARAERGKGEIEIGRENKEKGSTGGTGRKGGKETCEVTEARKRGRDDGDKVR